MTALRFSTPRDSNVYSVRACRTQDLPDWRRLLPREWTASVIEPRAFSRFRDYEILSERVLGHEASPDESPTVLDTYANTSSAGSIIAFHLNSGDLKAGDTGLICSFGAGYSAGTVFLRKAA